MGRFLTRLVVAVGALIGVLVLGVLIWAALDRFGVPELAISYEDNEQPLSNEVLFPDQISKNPYRWKGHSGIFDTRVAIEGPAGRFLAPIPGGCLKFERMIDEHTATFEVLVGGEEVRPDGEIAVILEDSNPPDPALPWRVFVEGPRNGVNGFGNSITVTTVRFEGYATIPRPVMPTPPAPPPKPVPAPGQPPTVPLPEGTQPPAPIERQPPN
jgi:hypothetical protein